MLDRRGFLELAALSMFGSGGDNPQPVDLDCFGDSHTYNVTYLTGYSQYYPSLWQERFRLNRANVSVRNSGQSGDTTGDVLVRANARAAPSRPSIGLVYAGTNDFGAANIGTVQASPSPTTTVFTLDAGKGARFPVGVAVLVNGESRIVQSVSTDQLTLSVALSGAPSAGASVTLDTQTNLVAIGNRLIALGYTRLMVGVQHYFNWSSSGDTVATPQASAQLIRAPQIAAAAALNATEVNFHTYMRSLIVAGTYVQGSFSWHVADGNSHLNAIGEQLLADCVLSKVPVGWFPALH